ncbi:HNH endonuclease [Thalassoglobus polymorphus]|uniref:HNH endonuclease 5 domain-containing protein n=1 Tax=Thalassoglobus polymorphus TaxID=2527994 RepID=A0A517QNW3_9PLAN|nr:HNH endonuclease [Thalassoglobus polymorphus]QDT33302.1 hypothetical protein Mal48_25550 [Thalassoglobus polymorphus]
MKRNKKALFENYRASQTSVDLPTDHEDALICPLCWEETAYNDLSIEHALPGSVGGSAKVLTCRSCNNEHGSSLDSHLSQFQKLKDALQGHGTIATELNINGKRMVANLDWKNKNFHVVGKATDPRVNDLVKDEFQAGLVEKMKVTFSFGYAKNQFNRAALRAAYLVLFRCFGYQYVVHDVVQILRRRICDPTQEFPRLGSMIVEFRNKDNFPDHEPHLVSVGNVNDVQFFLVILRVKKATISHIGVFMPAPTAPTDLFFELMDRCSQEHNGD